MSKFYQNHILSDPESEIVLSGSTSSLTVFLAKMNVECDLNVFSREGSGSVPPVLPTISMSDLTTTQSNLNLGSLLLLEIKGLVV